MGITIYRNIKSNILKSTVIGNVYRAQKSKNGPLNTFITECTNILSSIQNKKSSAYMCGDYNIYLLKIKKNINIMSSKTVKFYKKKHKGNDSMTYDLLDLINLNKNRL